MSNDHLLGILVIIGLLGIGFAVGIFVVESPEQAYERGRQDAVRSLQAEETEFIKCWNEFKKSFDSTDTMPAVEKDSVLKSLYRSSGIWEYREEYR